MAKGKVAPGIVMNGMSRLALKKKTLLVGSMTALSRVFGLCRAILLMRFLGSGVVSDAFLTAWRLPNFFRKVFAEGALSAAFVPVFVRIVKEEDEKTANGLMTLSFLFFEGILVVITTVVVIYPTIVVQTIVPGFTPEQVAATVPLLRIMFPFILCISTSALLAGALQTANHFFVPAFGPALMNLFWISALSLSLYFGLGVKTVAYGALIAGVAQLILHIIVYVAKGFTLGPVTASARRAFGMVIGKFLPCLLGASVMEANLFIDQIIASYLPTGTITLLYYGNRFMQIPLGIFAIALSTTLLPYISRTVLYAPRRMRYYLLEASKAVTWVIVPSAVFLMFCAHQIFSMFFDGGHAPLERILAGKVVLIIYCTGLVFFSINKILISMHYAYRDTLMVSLGFAVSAIVNIVGDYFGSMIWGVNGIVGATVVSGAVFTLFLIGSLYFRHNVTFYFNRYLRFVARCCAQFAVAFGLFYAGHILFFATVPLDLLSFFSEQWGYWLVVFPLAFLAAAFMVKSRRLFGIRVSLLQM